MSSSSSSSTSSRRKQLRTPPQPRMGFGKTTHSDHYIAQWATFITKVRAKDKTNSSDRPDLFLAYWFGGASVNTADPAGAADVTDRFQNCNTNDDNDVDFVDYDLSLWFRVGNRLVDDDAILEQRRLANAPTTSAAKDTIIWKTPTADVVRPIATPPTRRYQVPCAEWSSEHSASGIGPLK